LLSGCSHCRLPEIMEFPRHPWYIDTSISLLIAALFLYNLDGQFLHTSIVKLGMWNTNQTDHILDIHYKGLLPFWNCYFSFFRITVLPKKYRCMPNISSQFTSTGFFNDRGHILFALFIFSFIKPDFNQLVNFQCLLNGFEHRVCQAALTD